MHFVDATREENKVAERLVVAFGGNAILRPKQKGTAEEQFENVRTACQALVGLVKSGAELILTHGNGPQVGNILLQNEAGKDIVPAMPLDICGSKTQGFIGYMIQQSFFNELRAAGLSNEVATVVTQVVVSEEDPAFANPTKPIGPFYSEVEAHQIATTKGFVMKEDAGRGWRRVVPSPDPQEILEKNVIATLVKNGVIVVASGGGGIPVVRKQGRIVGVEAVIDKDLAGQRLALDVRADTFVILTDVQQVALNYGQSNQTFISEMTLAQAKRYQEEKHFKAGSMGPKVQAAVRFVETGGKRAIIGSLAQVEAALQGKAGTIITH
jgi:carbamate kinase